MNNSPNKLQPGGVSHGGRQGLLPLILAFALGVTVCYTVPLWEGGPTGTTAAVRGAAAGGGAAGGTATLHRKQPVDRFHQGPCPPPRQPGSKRNHLVLTAVGDGWTPAKWNFNEQSSWDLVAIYYGNSSDWSCPECTLALRMPNSMKWQMVWALMTEQGGQWRGIWKRLRKSYDYVMVADDDLIMDACVIDTLFDTMRQRDLLVAQPSNCRGNDSDNPYWVHWQLPGLELHYVNVVEVTAPALQMEFLDTKLRPLLEKTYSGWGLPLCFNAAAKFSKEKMAVVDAVCMIHPAREPVGEKMTVSERIKRGLIKPGSLYARFAELTPFESPLQEQRSQWEECGYTAQATAKARQAYGMPTIHETVLAAQQGSVAAAAAAADGLWQSSSQQLLPVKTPRQAMFLAGLLLLAGAVGAAISMQCAKRNKGLPLLRLPR